MKKELLILNSIGVLTITMISNNFYYNNKQNNNEQYIQIWANDNESFLNLKNEKADYKIDYQSKIIKEPKKIKSALQSKADYKVITQLNDKNIFIKKENFWYYYRKIFRIYWFIILLWF